MNVSGRNSSKVNQNILQAIQKLRIFCNNGVQSIGRKELVASLSSDSKELPEEELKCTICSRDLATLQDSNDTIGGVIIPCHHYLCAECLATYIKQDEASEDGRIECPSCAEPGQFEYFGGDKAGEPVQNPQSTAEPPSKLLTVLATLRDQNEGDKRCVHAAFIFLTNIDFRNTKMANG